MMGMPLFRVWSLFLLFGMLTICISKIIYTNENEEERMTDKGKSKTSDTVTMKDVAALANVSIATVSRFLNGDLSRMSTNTAKTVKSAIDKLNYVPNSAARQMVTKSSGLIAIIVANIDDFFLPNCSRELVPCWKARDMWESFLILIRTLREKKN